MPRNPGHVFKRCKRILACELNMGHLLLLQRASFLVDACGLHKVQCRPFMISDIYDKIIATLGGHQK